MRFFIILCIPLFISCSKKKLDLNNISFPTFKDSIVKKTELEFTEESSYQGDFTNLKLKDKSIMYFDNLSLSGTLNKKHNDFFSSNKVTFWEDNKTKKIEGYAIDIQTTNKTLKFEKLLEKKFKKADFHYKNDKSSQRIWETNNKAYFYEIKYTSKYDGKNHIECNLKVLNKNNKLLYHNAMMGGFSFYEDYIEEKNKPKNKNRKFTYKDFVNQSIIEPKGFRASFYSKDFIE